MIDSNAIVPIAFAAFGSILAWIARRVMRDLKGVSKKLNRTVAVLVRWADTDEKRTQIADLMDGNGK